MAAGRRSYLPGDRSLWKVTPPISAEELRGHGTEKSYPIGGQDLKARLSHSFGSSVVSMSVQGRQMARCLNIKL